MSSLVYLQTLLLQERSKDYRLLEKVAQEVSLTTPSPVDTDALFHMIKTEGLEANQFKNQIVKSKKKVPRALQLPLKDKK